MFPNRHNEDMKIPVKIFNLDHRDVYTEDRNPGNTSLHNLTQNRSNFNNKRSLLERLGNATYSRCFFRRNQSPIFFIFYDLYEGHTWRLPPASAASMKTSSKDVGPDKASSTATELLPFSLLDEQGNRNNRWSQHLGNKA